MIILKTTVKDKDTVMVISQNGKKIKSKALGYSREKSIEGIPAGEYQVIAKNVIWKSQPYTFTYDGRTPITLVATDNIEYGIFEKLTTKRNEFFKIIEG